MTEEELNRLVVERAKQQVANRKQEPLAPAAETRQPRAVPVPREARNERPALWAFLGVLVTLMVGTLVLLPGTFVDRLGWIVHGVCAQEHGLIIGGVEMPLCQRNTGIYSGFLATMMTLVLMGRGRASRLPQRSILVLLVVNVAWMGIDGFNSLFKDLGAPYLYEPQQVLRVLSGLAMGMTIATMMLFAFNTTLRANPRREQAILSGWRDVALVAAVELTLFAFIQLNLPLLVYPLAIFSTLGILGVMFTVNLIVAAMITRFEGGVHRLTQLAVPAIGALVFTGVEFGLLAWGRAALERSIG